MATPTKATKRAPARKAAKTAPPAAPPPDEVVTAGEATAEDGPVTITWRDRTMPVKRPSAAMIGVWALTAKQLTNAAQANAMTNEDAADAAGRAIQIVVSVLEDPDDKAWVIQLLLDDVVTIEEAAGILPLTNDAYQAMGNRDERRTASKARLR